MNTKFAAASPALKPAFSIKESFWLDWTESLMGWGAGGADRLKIKGEVAGRRPQIFTAGRGVESPARRCLHQGDGSGGRHGRAERDRTRAGRSRADDDTIDAWRVNLF